MQLRKKDVDKLSSINDNVKIKDVELMNKEPENDDVNL